MVRLNENAFPPAESPSVVQPAQAVEDSFGEQYFPREMSWYAPEGPQGWAQAGARKVREHPWAAVGVALAAGLALAWIASPLLTAAISTLRRGSSEEGCCEGQAAEQQD